MTTQPDDSMMALTARYGASSLQEVIRIKAAATGLDPASALMAVVDEMIKAELAEDAAHRDLAMTAACPYCAAEPGHWCVRVRGQFAGRSFQYERKNWHGARFSVAAERQLAALLAGEEDR